MRVRRLAAGLAVLLVVVAACGEDDGGVSIDGVWSRASATMQNAGAVYMDLSSADGDTLIGVSVDSSIAAEAQIHETVMTDMDDDMSDDTSDDMSDDMGDMGGAMTMQQLSELSLPAGESVPFEPGGYHVMLMDLVDELEIGETFELTLQFENAGDITVDVEVREEAP